MNKTRIFFLHRAPEKLESIERWINAIKKNIIYFNMLYLLS